MVALSAHFAALACLCAAIPFALIPPVEAAHLYGGSSMGQRAPFPHSYSQVHGSSFSDGPAPALDYNNEHPHRSSFLPPLLRRYRSPSHVQKFRGQPHDYSDHKVPKSVFARSRYRQGVSTFTRRSSVYVPGEHGSTYLVSRSPRKHSGAGKRPSHTYMQRQVGEVDLALGRIDIMGTVQSPSLNGTQRLGSLTVDSTPIDWVSGQTSVKAFQLNASTANQTQFIMMPMDGSSDAGSFNKHVALATEVFDANSAEMVMYCATYNPDPAATSALLMTPCITQSANDAGDPCADDNNASLSNPHESQLFSYDPSTGKIEPMSAAASSSNAGSRADVLASCTGARVRRADNSSTTSGSATSSITSTRAAPTPSASPPARNVTLVYVAGAPEVLAASSSSSATSTSPGRAPVSTITTTVTTVIAGTTTTSGSASRTFTPPQAAVSVTLSSMPSQSTTTSAPSSFSTRRSITNPTTTGSVSAAATPGALADADASFEVEVVGVTASAAGSSSSTSTTTTSHSSTSPTLSP